MDKKAAAASSHASTLMQIPPTPSKQTLGLTQSFLVLQLRLLAKKSLTIEINILSLKDKRQRYRLHLSNKFRSVEVHQMHAQIPLTPLLATDAWTHLIVDVAHLTSYFFKNRDFGSIDSISLHTGCRLRVSIILFYEGFWCVVACISLTFESPTCILCAILISLFNFSSTCVYVPAHAVSLRDNLENIHSARPKGKGWRRRTRPWVWAVLLPLPAQFRFPCRHELRS